MRTCWAPLIQRCIRLDKESIGYSFGIIPVHEFLALLLPFGCDDYNHFDPFLGRTDPRDVPVMVAGVKALLCGHAELRFTDSASYCRS
jgi:hypothetical protein